MRRGAAATSVEPDLGRDLAAGSGSSRCNILALIGGVPNPQYPINKVMIWDDHQSRCIGELSFHSEVRGIRLHRNCIIVILTQKIFVYNFADLKLSHQTKTIVNPRASTRSSTPPSPWYWSALVSLRRPRPRPDLRSW